MLILLPLLQECPVLVQAQALKNEYGPTGFVQRVPIQLLIGRQASDKRLTDYSQQSVECIQSVSLWYLLGPWCVGRQILPLGSRQGELTLGKADDKK